MNSLLERAVEKLTYIIGMALIGLAIYAGLTIVYDKFGTLGTVVALFLVLGACMRK